MIFIGVSPGHPRLCTSLHTIEQDWYDISVLFLTFQAFSVLHVLSPLRIWSQHSCFSQTNQHWVGDVVNIALVHFDFPDI